MASKTIKNLATDQGDGERPFLSADALLKEDAEANPEWGTIGALRGITVVSATANADLVDPIDHAAGAGEVNVGAGGLCKGNSASAITLTVVQADVADGWNCTVAKWGAGDVTIAAGAGLTLRTAVSAVLISQYSALHVQRIGADLWVV